MATSTHPGTLASKEEEMQSSLIRIPIPSQSNPESEDSHNLRTYCLKISENFICAGTADGRIHLFSKSPSPPPSSRARNPPLWTSTAPADSTAVTSLELSEQLGVAISGDTKGTLRVHRLSDGQVLQKLRAHEDTIQSLHLSRSEENEDGTDAMLVSASRDQTVKVWGVSRTLVQRGGVYRPATAFTFSLTLGDKKVAQIGRDEDDNTGVGNSNSNGVELTPKYTLNGHEGNVADAKFASVSIVAFGKVEGQKERTDRLISTSGDRSLRVWSLPSPSPARGPPTSTSTSPTSNSASCIHRFSPGASICGFQVHPHPSDPRKTVLVGACTDSTIRLYTVSTIPTTSTCTETACLRGHTNVVRSVALTRDGEIVSASYDGSLKIWTQNSEPRGEGLDDEVRWECVRTLSFSDAVTTRSGGLRQVELEAEGEGSEDGEEWVEVQRDQRPVRVFDVQVDGSWVYACGEAGEIVGWNLAGDETT